MKQPLPKKVHAALKTRLLEGALPPGSRLDYKKLAVELGVSTTPVREAVMQLATEGFVELVPRLGALVRSLSRPAAQELYEVREALETHAAWLAAERMSPRHIEHLRQQLAVMRRVFDAMPDTPDASLEPEPQREFLNADLAFHQTVLAGARNSMLARTLEESQIQTRIFLADRGVHDRLRVSLACTQHAEILAALEQREPNTAAAAMRRHIRQSLQLTLDHLDSLPATEGIGFSD